MKTLKEREYNQLWNQRNPDKVRAYNRKWRKGNPEKHSECVGKWVKANMGKVLENHRRNYQKLKRQVFTHYSDLTCAECGCDDFGKLSIDHINGGGNAHLRELGFNSSRQFYAWLKRNNYPDGYRVLCIGCNSSIKSYKGRICLKTSEIIKKYMQHKGIVRIKNVILDLIDFDINNRMIDQAFYRLVKSGEINRISRGHYSLNS